MQSLNPAELARLLESLFKPSALIELAVLAGCLLLAWLLVRGLRGAAPRPHSIWFGNGVVDGVVMFRFLHHLAPDARRRAIAEACRTARRFVVASFFHPCSAHHLQRRLRQLGGATPTRFAVTLRGIVREFASHGFELHAKAADLPFARDLWVASFVRNGVLARRPVGSAP